MICQECNKEFHCGVDDGQCWCFSQPRVAVSEDYTSCLCPECLANKAQLVTNDDIGGDLVKDTEVYQIKDNKFLRDLILSSTKLYRGQVTRGHRHPGQEEIYFFFQGYGKMVVGNEDTKPFSVKPGDIVLIPNGAFHRVINDGDMNLIFNCVFNGTRNH